MPHAATPKPPSRFARAFFYCSFAFITSGALNYGVTTYFWAIPFAIYAIRYASRHFESRWPLLGVVVFIGSGLVFNETIEKNPLVFPILVDGYLQEVRRPAGPQKSRVGEPAKESLRVIGVYIGHADLGTQVQLIDSDGRTYLGGSNDPLFYSYTGGKKSEFGFRPSGPVENPAVKLAGELMWYPWLPFLAYQSINRQSVSSAR